MAPGSAPPASAMPGPNRARTRASGSSSRQASTTAREPMCFSSQITAVMPSAAYPANASAGCSSRSGRADVAHGAMVGGR